MPHYTNETWEQAITLLKHGVSTPYVKIEMTISGPPAVGKEDPSRGLKDTLEEHGFDVLMRHEAPGDIPNNKLYALRTQGFSVIPEEPHEW